MIDIPEKVVLYTVHVFTKRQGPVLISAYYEPVMVGLSLEWRFSPLSKWRSRCGWPHTFYGSCSMVNRGAYKTSEEAWEHFVNGHERDLRRAQSSVEYHTKLLMQAKRRMTNQETPCPTK